jgi:hypothetical protein
MSKAVYKDRWNDKVGRFNKCFPPGTPAIYTPSNGMRFKTEIRYPAIILSNGTPVVWLKNIREYCRFDRVVVV